MRVELTVNDQIETLQIWFEYSGTHTICRCEFRGKADHGAPATLAAGDRFCRATGRRVALTRLLKTGLLRLESAYPTTVNPNISARWVEILKFTREMRREVWMAYFKSHADLRRRK